MASNFPENHAFGIDLIPQDILREKMKTSDSNLRRKEIEELLG